MWFPFYHNYNLPNKSPLNVALGEVGVRELPRNNPRILQYMSETGFTSIDQNTAWCSIFINWCCMKASRQRSYKATARSWLDVGSPVTKPKLGDVVIFWRESKSSWKGHVGFFITKRNGYVYCLGGNQRNSVCIQAYKESRVLGYRNI